MPPSDSISDRQQIEQAIAAQENLRGQVDDALIDATIATLKEKLAALDSSPEQQRKLATILFMDIVDHTALTRGMDPEDQMALIDPLIARLAGMVTEFGGHVARYQGDGFKAVFGLPVARENDPEKAIRAGLAIQGEADAISTELEAEHGIGGFKVRVGITTGQVFAGGVTEGEDTIKGSPVNLAARLERTAEPGTVLISYDTYKFVRGIFHIEQLEPIQVKGFTDPVQVFKVVGAKPRAFYRGRPLVEGIETRMIGRDAELEGLKDAFYTVLEDGASQFVTITGEAGIGKSRLLYEFENWVDLQREDVRLYRGRAYYESRRIPYDLLRSIFAFRFNIQDNDPLDTVKEKWLAGFSETSQPELFAGVKSDLEMRAHILGQLLGYDFSHSLHVKPLLGEPQQMRDRSMLYLEGYFTAAAREMPVLVMLEDLHWADGSSLDALNRLGLELREVPVLVVMASRPELYERRPYWFEGRDFHRRINLKPLSRRVNRQLVNEVLQYVEDIPEELSDLILNNAEGNPFYVEELVKVLVEAGVIVKGDPLWQVDEGALAELDIPSTLTGVLQARLERLPKEEFELIQQASVVGRVFWDQAVWYLTQQGEGTLKEQDIQDGLVDLRDREMIYRRELSAFQEAREYIFKHAVLREVTYESVLKKLRRVYHALAAEWLMEQRADRSGEIVGLIADHLERAGEKEDALRYLRWAGEEAAKKYANDEAVDYFGRAMALVPEHHYETHFQLLLSREEVLNLQAKRKAQHQDLKNLKALSKELGSLELQLEVDIRWSKYLLQTHDYQACVEAAQQVVSQADEAKNIPYAARGHLIWGSVLMHQDRDEIARAHLEMALNGFRATRDERMEGSALRLLGAVAAGMVNLEAWKDYSQKALSKALKVGSRSDEAEAINHLGHVDGYSGNFNAAMRSFMGYLSLSREIGSRYQERMALNNLGWVSIDLKDFQKAQSYYQQSLTTAQTINDRLGMAISLQGMGDAFAGQEKFDAAVEAYIEAIDLYEEISNEWGIAGSHSGLAGVALAQGNEVEALINVNACIDFLLKFEGLREEVRGSYLTCIQVLQAVGDPRATSLLNQAYTQIQDIANKINDKAMKQSFLGNLPWNQEIVRLWEEQQAKQ